MGDQGEWNIETWNMEYRNMEYEVWDVEYGTWNMDER